MRTLVLILVLCAASVSHAKPPYVVAGGRSPGGRWEVAVRSDRSGEEAMLAEEDHSEEKGACLVNAHSRRIVATLSDVATNGGGWGHTRGNVRALWSPDGRFVAVDYRVGRMSSDFMCYAVTKTGRVRPQELPEVESLPKGHAYLMLKHGANGGMVVKRWTSRTSFLAESYGAYLPEIGEGREDIPGWLADLDGILEWVYAYEDGRWRLKDLRVPERQPDAGQTRPQGTRTAARSMQRALTRMRKAGAP